MSKKIIGYVELEWTCPNCSNKNPGMKKTCLSCGSPQPGSVQFELGQKRDLITDGEKAANAAGGADIHCPFCNTRNFANAQVCVQCGGDLKEGLKHESGRVVSASPVSNIPLNCPSCSALNQVGNTVCSACGASLVKPLAQIDSPNAKPTTNRPWILLPVAAILILLCVIFGFLFFRTTEFKGIVKESQWKRAITVEQQREVTKEAWQDQVPGDAKILSCQKEYRTRQDTPAEGAKEVCSTELVDKGNGAAEIQETCYYEVYDNFCKYQALEWQATDYVEAQGSDLKPYWPQIVSKSGQREGERSESYRVTFETEDGIKEFTTTDAVLFVQLRPGTEWTLSVNTLGSIVGVSR